MERPRHDVLQSATAPASSRRLGFLLVAGLINIAFVYSLTSGLATKIIRAIPKSMEVSIIASPDKPEPALTPPKMQMVEPTNQATVAPPDIQIQMETPPDAIAATTAPSAPITDSAAASRGSTHTIPPYPPEAKRLGQQGTVLLQLTISPAGDVIAAQVLQSSGFPLLDQTAASWVQTHWKYKPAVQGGAAVESTTTAAVKFDLKKA